MKPESFLGDKAILAAMQLRLLLRSQEVDSFSLLGPFVHKTVKCLNSRFIIGKGINRLVKYEL